MDKNFLKYLIICCILSTGCEQEVLIPRPEIETQMVVNGYAAANEVATVRITKSYQYGTDIYGSDFSNQERYVSDALVIVYTNELKDTLLPYINNHGFNVYEGKIKWKAGEKVYLQVMHPDFETVSASTIIPGNSTISLNEIVVIENGNTFYETKAASVNMTSNINTGYQLVMNYRINDPDDWGPEWLPDSINQFHFLNKFPFTTYDPRFFSMDTNPILDERDNDVYHNDGIGLFRNFGEQNNQVLINPNGGFNETSLIVIRISSISKETYDYLKAIKLQTQTADDPLISGVRINGNIQNGLGFFMGLNFADLEIKSELFF